MAWAAGLWEGEGCFYTFRQNGPGACQYHYPRAQMNSTDLDVLEAFHRIVGVGYINGPVRDKRGGHLKPQWQYQVTKYEDVVFLVNLLLPWLCSRRRAKALEVLSAPRGRQEVAA